MTPLAKKVFKLFGVSELAAETGRRQEAEHPSPSPWPCTRCGHPAVIEDVCPSLDGQRTLTLRHCDPCQTWGVTPNTLREPPVWVSKREQ